MARKDRDQQSNTTGDRAQSAMGGGRTGVGAGTQAMSGNTATITRGRPALPTGPNTKVTQGKQAPATPDRNVTLDSHGDPTHQSLGGTSTTDQYVPGAVENHPYANAAAVADMLTGAVPIAGALSTAYKGAKALTGEDATFGPLGDALGADAGPQRGWQPDRTRQMTGGPGGTDPREIPGRSYGAAVASMVGDLVTDPVTGEVTDYSDEITLRDRRRPYDDLSLEQQRKQVLSMI